MKKQLFILTALFILTTGMAGCEGEEKGKGYDCGIIKIDDSEFVTMQVSPKKISQNYQNLSLIIENHTKKDVIYNTVFSLEYFDGHNWSPINLDISFEAIGYILNSEMVAKEQVYLSSEYFKQTGIYRINKAITIMSKHYSICSKFEVY